MDLGLRGKVALVAAASRGLVQNQVDFLEMVRGSSFGHPK